MFKQHFKIIILLISTFLLFFSCRTDSHENEEATIIYEYRIPEQIGDGWETASLTDVGINPEYLEDLMNTLLNRRGHLVHSILLVRHGKLVFEEYFSGNAHPTIGGHAIDFDRDTWHVLSSATKSYTSALLGIAIEHGYIRSVHQKVFDFFPELAHLNVGQKSDLTIEHMITMSSGLQWDQTTYPILDSRNDIALIQHAADPWEMYLSRPLVTAPGSVFLYSEGSINLVGEIIKRASGMRLDHFAGQFLFTPLGIDRHWWYLVNPQTGFIWASGDLRQTPRDMARFGQLYLQGGEWEGRQIVPVDWATAAGIPYFTFPPGHWGHGYGRVGYSYAWWVKDSEYGSGAFAASGWGSQYILVVPDFDLVALFTGGSYYQDPFMRPHDMMIQYVLPALL